MDGETSTTERCSFIVKYTTQKVFSIRAMPFVKEQNIIFLLFFLDWNCKLVVAWISYQHYCAYPVFHTPLDSKRKKKRRDLKQYMSPLAAILLIFIIILLDLFFTMVEHDLKMKSKAKWKRWKRVRSIIVCVYEPWKRNGLLFCHLFLLKLICYLLGKVFAIQLDCNQTLYQVTLLLISNC